MPNWNQPFDIYNNNKYDNFNAHNVVKITQDHIDIYFPYDACWVCKLQHENPLRTCFRTDICKLRIKDVRMNNVVVTKALFGDKKHLSVHMRSGLMGWLYFHRSKCDVIFRPSNENGTVLHHKDLNPFNNHWTNISIVDLHEKHHANLRLLEKAIEKLIRFSKTIPDKRPIEKVVKNLQNSYKHFSESIQDSPRVFIIISICNKFYNGLITQTRAEELLEKYSASIPPEILEKYDMRKIKYQNDHILEYERNADNAIQDIQQLVI